MSQEPIVHVPAGDPLTPASGAKRRCAIYARVSVSADRDLELNSLQAQVEACESYIHSQRGLGWELVAPPYIDDGYSGESLDRPAMHQLFLAVEAGKFDAVIVQRLDRLCRSVRDICDLLPTFTITRTALVSVTQSIDSESPMGRLAIHLLTSFGQFERELIGDRIREKVAITRFSGKWQRNGIPLGYVLNELRELQIEPKEAAVARDIFRRFLAVDSVPPLLAELNSLGYRTKLHISRNGNRHGGKPFDRNTLNQLLRNRMYIGEVFYRDAWHVGKQEPIIDRELWDQVQAIRSLRALRAGVPNGHRSVVDFPLGDRLFWHNGRAYTMLETNLRKGRRYRYYKPPALSNAEHSAPMTIPAPMLHKVVIDHLRECFKNPQPWLDDLPEEWKARPELAPIHVTESLLVLDSIWHSLQPPLMTTVIQSFVERVVMYPDQMEVVLNVPGLSEFFQGFSVKKLKKQ